MRLVVLPPPPPAEHPGEGFEGWFWDAERLAWYRHPKGHSFVRQYRASGPGLKGDGPPPYGEKKIENLHQIAALVVDAERKQKRFAEEGGRLKITIEGTSFEECVNQMVAHVEEWEGQNVGEDAPPLSAALGVLATEPPKRRGRGPGRKNLQSLASPAPAASAASSAPSVPWQSAPATPAGGKRIWNVCQFHAQAVAKVGAPHNLVAPHECEGCKTMAQGQSFEGLLGLGAAPAAVASATPPPAGPPSGMSVDNVKSVMRELVGAKIKASSAKTDAEVEAAAKPISDWLAANFKTADGRACQMASEIQVVDYGRFVELASKLAAETIPAKKSMFD